MAKNEAYDRLVRKGIKPSVQRIAIMQYLLEHKTHPTVDDVYKGLCREMPTLSRTTVYNTLRLLSDNNAVQMITIDEHRVCYDGVVEPHTHFYCKQCKSIIDIDDNIPFDSRKSIDGNSIDCVQLYYRGTCSKCLSKKRE